MYQMQTMGLKKIREDYLKQFPKHVSYWGNEMVFTQMSYSIHAVDEVFRYLYSRIDMDPVDALSDFIHRMNDYACLRPNGIMFSIAADVATDILDKYFLGGSQL